MQVAGPQYKQACKNLPLAIAQRSCLIKGQAQTPDEWLIGQQALACQLASAIPRTLTL